MPYTARNKYPGSFRCPSPAFKGNWEEVKIIARWGLNSTGYMKPGGKYAYFLPAEDCTESGWRCVETRTHLRDGAVSFIIELHSEYEAIKKCREAYGEKNDCGVTALSVATGESYKRCHLALETCGRKPRDGTFHHQMRDAAKLMGYTMQEILRPSRYRLQDKDPSHYTEARTVTTLEPLLPKDQRILVEVSGHYLGCADGKVVDWTRGRRFRIIRLYKFVKQS